MKTKTLQHLNPIWRDKANFIIGIEVPSPVPEIDMAWEQLWSKQLSENRFCICCIPFFARNISLGDDVVTNTDYMIQKVVKPSGQFTYRVWFGDSKEPNIRSIIIDEVNQIGCLIEWYSNNLLSISCSENNTQLIGEKLMRKQQEGLIYYESGNTT
jgi:hypothetical protein